MKKCLIVDDEEFARQLIKEYLSNFEALSCIGEASDGKTAAQMIDDLKPDVVFLDIQMPEMNGFEVLENISFYPTIIFSTAYDDYAIKAFEVHAIDYLLKPYTRSRFEKAIARLDQPDNKKKQMQLIEDQLLTSRNYPQNILVERKNQFYNVATASIIKIEAYGDYAKIFTGQHSYISKSGLSKLAEKLDPADFMRIHRSTIINKAALVSLTKLGKGYLVKLSDDSEVKVSKSYASEVKAMIY